MAADPHRPILFLAFANDRADAPEHLRNLAEESRRLRRTLKATPYADTYTVEHEDHAKLDDILDCFQQYRSRVAIFHFGGYADRYQILIEQTGGLTITDGTALTRFVQQATTDADAQDDVDRAVTDWRSPPGRTQRNIEYQFWLSPQGNRRPCGSLTLLRIGAAYPKADARRAVP